VLAEVDGFSGAVEAGPVDIFPGGEFFSLAEFGGRGCGCRHAPTTRSANPSGMKEHDRIFTGCHRLGRNIDPDGGSAESEKKAR